MVFDCLGFVIVSLPAIVFSQVGQEYGKLSPVGAALPVERVGRLKVGDEQDNGRVSHRGGKGKLRN